jgi:hypothetical protein
MRVFLYPLKACGRKSPPHKAFRLLFASVCAKQHE